MPLPLAATPLTQTTTTTAPNPNPKPHNLTSRNATTINTTRLVTHNPPALSIERIDGKTFNGDEAVKLLIAEYGNKFSFHTDRSNGRIKIKPNSPEAREGLMKINILKGVPIRLVPINQPLRAYYCFLPIRIDVNTHTLITVEGVPLLNVSRQQKMKNEGRKQTGLVFFNIPPNLNHNVTHVLCDNERRAVYDASTLDADCAICHSFDHWTNSCKKQPQCGICSLMHHSKVCPNNKKFNKRSPNFIEKCPRCNGPHTKWDPNCTAKVERAALKEAVHNSTRRNIPTTRPIPQHIPAATDFPTLPALSQTIHAPIRNAWQYRAPLIPPQPTPAPPQAPRPAPLLPTPVLTQTPHSPQLEAILAALQRTDLAVAKMERQQQEILNNQQSYVQEVKTMITQEITKINADMDFRLNQITTRLQRLEASTVPPAAAALSTKTTSPQPQKQNLKRRTNASRDIPLNTDNTPTVLQTAKNNTPANQADTQHPPHVVPTTGTEGPTIEDQLTPLYLHFTQTLKTIMKSVHRQ